MYHIYPEVSFQNILDGYFTFKEVNLFCERNKNVFIELRDLFKINLVDSKKEANIKYILNETLEDQEYEIEITPTEIDVFSSSDVGFYYATKTLKQIMCHKEIRCLQIKDHPDLKVRGLMYDISRNKVPKVETLKYLIDIMSDLRMNHLELYVEGFSFEYKSFPEYLEKESFITVEEYQEIEAYANMHYIDLVPNQNGFGHMSEWLAKPELKDLAEAPDGIDLWGTHRAPSTLNAIDPKSIELISKMYQDMLPISNSKYFNMNFDEPFELGKDKTKEVCDKYGVENIYLDYVKKAYDIIKSYNKTPLIWGDVLIKHDNVLDKIPKDMIFIDWGYEAEYPFDKNLKKLSDAGIKFMAAPATTSWCSLLGRTYDYMENISSAAWHTYELGGEGIILTDWGDAGHLQHISLSFAPIVYAGLISYRVSHGIFKETKEYLNKYIFKDKVGLAADVFMDSGTYYKYEPHYRGNGTITFYSLVWILNAFKEKDPVEYFRSKMKGSLPNKEQFTLLDNFFNQKKEEVKLCDIDDQFKKELTNSVNILKMMNKVNVGFNEDVDLEFRLNKFKEAHESIDGLITDLKEIWLVRNKYSRLDKSVDELLKVKEFIEKSTDFYRGGTHETKD